MVNRAPVPGMSPPRLLILGSSGRLGAMLRTVWGGGPRIGPDGPSVLWQSRRGLAGGGSQAILDPLAAPEALRRAVAAADVVLSLAGPAVDPAADHGQHAALARAVVDARDAVAAGPDPTPILLMSSAAVYGSRDAAAPLDEGSACVPVGAYGHGKRAMERAVEGAAAVCVLRLGNVVGADALVGRALPGRPVTLDRFPDGATPTRSYVGPFGLARLLAALVALAARGRLPGVLNVAAGRVEMAALLDAARLPWKARPAPDGAIRSVILDTARLDALATLPAEARTAAGMVAELCRLRGLDG